jgi:hypothetical protein
MPRKRSIGEEDELDFVRDYQSLRSIRGLADKWGIHWRTAHKTLSRLGVHSERKGGPPKRDDYHPMLGKWSDRKVAKDLGISHQAVSTARTRRGIPPHTKTVWDDSGKSKD